MEEIVKLFETTEKDEIKKLLEIIISKIENEDRENQNKFLGEIVKQAKSTSDKLRKEYMVNEVISFYPNKIAPLALLTEEIVEDAEIEKDMLKVLKFILNNYFKQFKEAESTDWHIEVKELERALQILEAECNYFSIISKKINHLAIFYFNYRYRKNKMLFTNYNVINNLNYSIQIYYSNENAAKDNFEICLEQFGFLLKSILVGESKKVPDNFLSLFNDIDMPEIDSESKEATELFVNSFAHYIIEKMEIRITKKIGKGWKETTEFRDEQFVGKLVQYFDNIFEKLKEEEEEWDDNEKCPCGSGKKYAKCCKNKNMKYFKSKQKNEYIKSVPVHPIATEILENEQMHFKRIFGRMPGNENLIFGGILPNDLAIGHKILKRKGDIDKAWLYAVDKSGFMLTSENENLLSDRDTYKFKGYMKEYKKIMSSKIKGNKWNELQAVEAISFILEYMNQNKIDDMIYCLNVFINFYSKDKQKNKKFIIQDIKDFLVFGAYKASINLKALKELVDGEYYDNAMAVDRILFEILINIKTYKKDSKLFKKKILPVAGIDNGTHRKIDKYEIEDIETGEKFKFNIEKKQLAEKAGENYKKLYDTFYAKVSEFIHLDAIAAKNIFNDNDLFSDIDECLIAGFLGMIFGLEIIIELIEFNGNDKTVSKDIEYFSNNLTKEFIPIIQTIITIDDKEIYHIFEDILEENNKNYKVNYSRNINYEAY